MTISREEFLRLLPAAVGGAVREDVRDVFTGFEGSRHWTLNLVPMTDWQVGSLSLARHRVEIRLSGYTTEEAAAFATRFHRQFQRGGG